MKAVIIAAGKGRRMGNLTAEAPKALIKILGLSLIERVILTAKDSGIKDFLVVIGYQGEKIKNKLGDGRAYGVKIKYVENKEWGRENGISVLKIKNKVKGSFILLMADHLYDKYIIKKLKNIRVKSGQCVVAVDPNPKNIDLIEATKVKINNGFVSDIGKKINDYNGIDCGAFKLSPSIFTALKESIKNGDETLSGGIRILAKKGKMIPLLIKNRLWFDIDNKKDIKTAETLLCATIKKPTDGPISKWLNRPLSIVLSKFLTKTNITPNTISIISFSMGFLASIFFSNRVWSMV